jgi:hypothetical protein
MNWLFLVSFIPSKDIIIDVDVLLLVCFCNVRTMQNMVWLLRIVRKLWWITCVWANNLKSDSL